MRKLRIGVWLHEIAPTKGGAYGYYTEIIRALSTYPFKDAEIVFLSDKNIASDSFVVHVIKNKPHKSPILRKILEKMKSKQVDAFKNEIYAYADIVYYPTQFCFSTDIPYIYTLWDLGHLDTYAFPELVMNGNFEYRRKNNDLIVHKALAIFTESETGKNECERYLNIHRDRIKVIPIFPSGVVNTECTSVKPIKIKEGEMFIHYTAQYWAHKNHYNLLLAMVEVVKKFPEIKLIFTGSDKGNKEYILKTVNELNLTKNVIDLGFVSLPELRWLYQNSHGLIMPTLFGPTNMPPLEAAELGCPVACTNLPG